MAATWVVVADSSAARIFTAASPTGDLEEVASYAHAEGRLQDRELRTDAPGRAFDSVGAGRHGMSPKVSPREHETAAFARLLGGYIEKARAKSEIRRVILVAPPEFLGQLRNTLDDDTKKIVEGEYNLNVVRMRAEEVRAHLPDKLYSTLDQR